MTLRAKLCGFSEASSLDAAMEMGAAFIGFVAYARSPRYVSPLEAAALAARLPAHAASVAVLVDPADAELETLLAAYRPHYLQLHGKETPERVSGLRMKFGIPIIKAIPVRTGDDVARAGAFADAADMLLFDAKAPLHSAIPGGNGLAFDWALLAGRHFPLPWFLSGGLSAENLEEAVRISGTALVDASSSLEIEPGRKNIERIHSFMQAVNVCNAAMGTAA